MALVLVLGLAPNPLVLAAGIEPTAGAAVVSKQAAFPGHPLSDRAPKTFDVPTSRLEEQLFVDVLDGRLDDFSPFDAALVASGVEDIETLRRYHHKAAAMAEELRQSGKLAGSPRERVEATFEFMHQRMLGGGYDLASTDLRRVLDQGRFNCVSATVLFNYLADEIGLECRGLEMPGHAMTRVLLADGSLDVETTCPRWFQLKDEPRLQSAALSQTIGDAASADRSKAREVSPIQLAAMIYYNRGVDFLNDKRFAEAAQANAKALRLDPNNSTARGNLLATINNWAIDLGNKGQFAEAIDLLRQGISMDAKFQPFRQNYVHVHRQWTDHLCREGHFDEALGILARVIDEMPNRTELRRIRSEVAAMRNKEVAEQIP